MKLFLGVDGGQSSTRALVADETGRVLGAGAGGPANHAQEGEGRAKLVRAVEASVGQACAAAGIDRRTAVFEAACFGMSGGPEDKREILGGLFQARRLEVTDDAAIALAGATAGEPGIITIAGTGSIAFGRNAAGRTARAGGWGYIFGDEGSAFDIVRQALGAILRHEEAWGPPTALRALLLEATGASGPNDVLHRFYTGEWPRHRVASLAPLVDRAAHEGDAVAARLLEAAGSQLAGLAIAVRERLWEPGQPAPAVYVGGVFESTPVLDRYRACVEQAGCICRPPVWPPAAGALLEAFRAAGLSAAITGLSEGKPVPSVH